MDSAEEIISLPFQGAAKKKKKMETENLTYKSCTVFTEGRLEIIHLLKIMDKSWSHFAV